MALIENRLHLLHATRRRPPPLQLLRRRVMNYIFAAHFFWTSKVVDSPDNVLAYSAITRHTLLKAIILPILVSF